MSFKDLVKEENKLKTDYKLIFIICSIICIFGLAIFILF